ncbi:hypothetical protein BC833DRAFT_624441 [Globomyces pollinis-pini]|nr:hypothetical protein BC833DRAFT_624441 [Globomyces pollinis-pini]
MQKRFLNVEYYGTGTRINVTDMEHLSEVQSAMIFRSLQFRKSFIIHATMERRRNENNCSAFPKVTDWQERFRILGGIPRPDRRANELLVAACRQCELRECIKIINLNSTAKAVYFLVHITSTHLFTKSSVSYSSATALELIVANLFSDAKREMEEKGGISTCRQLVHGNTILKPAVEVLTIPPSTRIVVEKVELGQTQNQLHVTITRNSTAMDSWERCISNNCWKTT